VRDPEIKRLLQCYRAADKDDPVFRAALEQVTRDPELAAWFQQEQAFDAVMIGKFREVSVDASAKERLLRMIEAARPTSTAEGEMP
jgi:uncharacterized protein (DUF924 family)